MKSSFKAIFAVAFIILFSLSSCKKNSSGPTVKNCSLVTPTSQFSEASISITYKMEITGDADVTSVFYYDETGKVVVQNPTFPFLIPTILTNQKTMQIGATGNVTNGSIKVSYEAFGNGRTYSGNDICSQGTP